MNNQPIVNTINKEEGTMENRNLNVVRRFNLSGESMLISIFTSELSRKLEQMGMPDALVKLKSLIDDKLPEEEKAVLNQNLQALVANGLHDESKTYVPFYIGSSDSRKAISAWIDSEIYAGIGKWAMCGLTTKNLHLAMNKFLAYIALLASSTRPFEQVFGRKLDPRRIAIVDDLTVTVQGKVDLVQGGDVTYDVDRNVSINAFDGCGAIMPNITRFTACTLRAPWMKCLVVPANFKKFARERGITSIKDHWGKEHAINDLDCILTASCFKMVKQYESWEQYCNAFEEFNHTICVCVEEHAPRLKWMPYQQTQTLNGNEDDVRLFAQMAARTVLSWQKPIGAAKLIGGWAGKTAALNHNLFADARMQEQLQENYASKRQKILGGKVPDLGYNAFLAPDSIALLEHVVGLPVKGVLKTGECFCGNCAEGEVDVTRNPHFDHAHVILNNVCKPNNYFMGPTMFINIWDLTTIRLRADYDGDHVWYSQNPHLLDLVHRTDAAYGNNPIDWDAPESVKGPINRAGIAYAFNHCTAMAQIGLYADALTKMFAHGYDRWACAWLTYAGNVLIDAAKHGNADVKNPPIVDEVMHSKLPLFAKYAKADTERPLDNDAYWNKRCEETDGFVDSYSLLCNKQLPKTLTVEGSDEFVFNVSDLMIDPHREVKGLTGLCRKQAPKPEGRWDNEQGKYIGEGLFQEIAFRHHNEWGELKKDEESSRKKSSWEEIRGKAAFEEIKAWVEERGKTIEDAYDIICRWVFTTSESKKEYMAVMKNAFWRIFGEMAFNTVKTNMEKAYKLDEDLTLDDVDWLDDDDEDSDVENSASGM